MAKLYSSDLESTSSLANSIESQELSDIARAKASINNFISDAKRGTGIRGPAWEAALNKLATYNNILEQRERAVQALKSAITSANNTMQAYLNGESFADDSKLDELNAEAESLQSQIAEYRGKIAQLLKGKDENRNFYESQINNLESQLNEIMIKIDWLERLVPTSNAAASSYADARSIISALESSINNFTVSEIK